MDNRIHAHQPTSTWSALDLTETMRRLPVISPRKLQRQSTDEPDLLTNWMMCPCLDSHSVAIPIRPTHRRTERATAGIFSIISSYVHMSSKVFITTPSSAIPIIIYYSLVPVQLCNRFALSAEVRSNQIISINSISGSTWCQCHHEWGAEADADWERWVHDVDDVIILLQLLQFQVGDVWLNDGGCLDFLFAQKTTISTFRELFRSPIVFIRMRAQTPSL